MKICKTGDRLSLAVLSWIHILLVGSGLYLLTSLLYAGKTPAELLAESLWLIFPAVLSWVFIRAIHSLIVYLLCSFIVCALLAGLSHSVLTVLLAAFILLVRCGTRIKKGHIKRLMMEMPGEAGAQLSRELWEIPTFLDRPVPGHWAAFAFYYAICFITKRDDLLKWIFYLLLADVFVCFLFGYLESMWDFIRENSKIANLPVHSIQKVSKILLLISVILLGLILLPSALYGREPLTALRDNIKPGKFTPPTEEILEEERPDNFTGSNLDMIAGTPTEPPAWLIAVTNVFMYLIVLAAAAALLNAIYRACRNALSYFSQDEEDEIIFLGTEETDSLRRGTRPGRAQKERRTSPNQKIRRIYKKTLRRSLKERPAGWETPSELEEKADLPQDAATAHLHSLYEKARYSDEDCTAEDVETLR